MRGLVEMDAGSGVGAARAVGARIAMRERRVAEGCMVCDFFWWLLLLLKEFWVVVGTL